MLEAQLGRCESAFKDALTMTGRHEANRFRHVMGGVLSDAWQFYCVFVRHLLIRSSTGCITASGVRHPASIVPATWERASYIALQCTKRSLISPVGVNSLLWKEPNWGDSKKILEIVPALNPGNATNLINHLAGGLNGPKHCQIVRNACAHRNLQTRAAVQALAASYIASTIRDPTESMTWRDPITKQFAFMCWLDDMRLISSGAVR